MKFPADLKQNMLRRSRAFPDGEFATVATSTGPVTIQSHVMAQGMIAAAAEAGVIAPSFEHRYATAAAAAMDAMNKGYPVEVRLQRVMVAARNTLGIDHGPVAS